MAELRTILDDELHGYNLTDMVRQVDVRARPVAIDDDLVLGKQLLEVIRVAAVGDQRIDGSFSRIQVHHIVDLSRRVRYPNSEHWLMLSFMVRVLKNDGVPESDGRPVGPNDERSVQQFDPAANACVAKANRLCRVPLRHLLNAGDRIGTIGGGHHRMPRIRSTEVSVNREKARIESGEDRPGDGRNSTVVHIPVSTGP
jgi:hypothetical protein